LLQALFDGEDDGNRFRICLEKGKYDWLYMIRGIFLMKNYLDTIREVLIRLTLL